MVNSIHKISLISLAAAALMLASGCTRDELTPRTAEEGVPVTAKLVIGAPDTDNVTVTTRSADINDLSDISSLYLFIFDDSGARCEQAFGITDKSQITETAPIGGGADGRHYTTTINTTSGTKTIYGIANYTTVASWKNFQARVEELGNKALNNPDFNTDSLDRSLFYLIDTYINNGTTPQYLTRQMIFTGYSNVTFSTSSSQAEGSLELERIVSMVNINIKNKADSGTERISFTPTNYRIYNIPKGTRLASRTTIDQSGTPPEAASSFYYNGRNENIDAADNDMWSISFYIPENIQRTADISQYHQRDEWDYASNPGASPEDKVWTYAPENATFIVISGEYAEYENVQYDWNGEIQSEDLKYSGTTSYTIHLGNFDLTSGEGSMGDFSIRRNWRYTYNITINGVDQVVTEARAENGQGAEPGAEGNIVNIDEYARSYSLDAHYEQVLLEYDLSNVVSKLPAYSSSAENADDNANGIPDIDELIGEYFMLYTESPFQESNIMHSPYQNYIEGRVNGEDYDAVKTEFLKGTDYKWVEFFPQSSSTTLSAYPGLPDWKNDSGLYVSNTLHNRLLDVYDACVKLAQAVKKLWKDGRLTEGDFSENGITAVHNYYTGKWYAYFTGFVDEYYYTKNPITGVAFSKWSEFTNKDQRRMMVSMDIKNSADKNSSYSTVHTNISQRSIQTFYDDGYAQELAAFGLETFNESEAMSYGQPIGSIYMTNDTDGRENTMELIGLNSRTLQWSNYVNYQYNGYFSSISGIRKLPQAFASQTAYSACLTRNRDLNGDGYIDENEIRWYLPSINEYIRIGMGVSVLSNEAQLYIGEKSDLSSGTYPSSFINDGALYFTSSNGKRVYWAVEKGAYGDQVSGYGGKFMIRCARLLPSDVGILEGSADPICTTGTTSNGNEILDFRHRLVTALYRQTHAGSQFNEHDEDDEENMFYSGLVISKDYMKTYSSWSWNYVTFGTDQASINRLQNVGSNQVNPCDDYSEAGDPSGNVGWRLPNLVELTVMASLGIIDTPNGYLIPACTRFSNQAVRQVFYFNSSKMITCDPSYGSSFAIRCVRDATDQELNAFNN